MTRNATTLQMNEAWNESFIENLNDATDALDFKNSEDRLKVITAYDALYHFLSTYEIPFTYQEIKFKLGRQLLNDLEDIYDIQEIIDKCLDD